MHPWNAHPRQRRAGNARRRCERSANPQGLPRSGSRRHSRLPAIRIRPSQSCRFASGVKLIIDAQFPPSLASALLDAGCDAVAVREIGLREAKDSTIWHYALTNGAAILTKDEDFADRCLCSRNTLVVVWFRRIAESARFSRTAGSAGVARALFSGRDMTARRIGIPRHFAHMHGPLRPLRRSQRHHRWFPIRRHPPLVPTPQPMPPPPF